MFGKAPLELTRNEDVVSGVCCGFHTQLSSMLGTVEMSSGPFGPEKKCPTALEEH